MSDNPFSCKRCAKNAPSQELVNDTHRRLDGRKATHLPIPAYRCVGAGEVTVIITVNNQGTVVDAKVDDGASSKDGCLRSFATRAARLSKFNASTTAPARQLGTITYLFIAQ